MKYDSKIICRLKQARNIYIFGAHLVAEEVARCLMDEPFHCNIAGFAVSAKGDNPQTLLGRPVVDLKDLAKRDLDGSLMVIACMDRHLETITDLLRQSGFMNILPLTFESDEWSEVQDLYLRSYCAGKNRCYRPYQPFVSGGNPVTGSTHVYSVRSVYDKKLKEQYEPDWEIPLQVGASLSAERLCDIRDNIGDNISEKNPQYCELTGLYWIWKHDRAEYKGICHYRRHFCLSKEDIDALPSSDVDVILTTPVVNFPDVKSVYCHDHAETDWTAMEAAVKRLAPEYEEDLRFLGRSRYYYAYNMFLARREIFDNYCQWLFPILDYCEKNCAVHKDRYQERFIGFLAERLMSVYFMHHEKNYRIYIARKHFVR